jgi:hypothetical protein
MAAERLLEYACLGAWETLVTGSQVVLGTTHCWIVGRLMLMLAGGYDCLFVGE